MREQIKFWFVVVVITLLIWFAAGQNVDEDQVFFIPVRLTSDNPDRYVALADPPYQVTVTATLRGRRRHLREFAELVASKDFFEVALDDAQPASTAPQSLASAQVLSSVLPRELRIGIIDPPTIQARVDEYATVEPVRVESLYGELKVTAVVTPTTVSVRLPRFLVESFRQSAVAIADAEKQVRARSKPDGSFKVSVPLQLKNVRTDLPHLQIKIMPTDSVTISGRIEALTQTRRKGPVQITFSVPHQVQEEYRIVTASPPASLRPDIEVVGPREAIDELDPREIRAFVDVLAADMEKPRTRIRRGVQFVLPPGYSLAPAQQAYEIEFSLEPRAAPPVK